MCVQLVGLKSIYIIGVIFYFYNNWAILLFIYLLHSSETHVWHVCKQLCRVNEYIWVLFCKMRAKYFPCLPNRFSVFFCFIYFFPLRNFFPLKQKKNVAILLFLRIRLFRLFHQQINTLAEYCLQTVWTCQFVKIMWFYNLTKMSTRESSLNTKKKPQTHAPHWQKRG